MAIEIERKFLVLSMEGIDLSEGLPIDQGYLSPPGGLTVRVRTKGTKGYLTIKAPLAGADPRESGGAIARHEFEYEIPFDEARALLDVSLARLQKTRHHLENGIELDVFHGRHEGLVVAEFESEDGSHPPAVPGITWREVTEDRRYSNSWLALNGIPG